MRRLAFIIAVVCCGALQAQNIRVLPAENLYMADGQMHRGIILGELVPEVDFRCFFSYSDIDSTMFLCQLFDHNTLETIPYFTVYAVHNDADYVVDSIVVINDFEKEWLTLFRTSGSQRRLFAVHAVGYVPLIIEYVPPVLPEIVQVSRRDYKKQDRSRASSIPELLDISMYRTFALSPEGYFVGQVRQGRDMRVVWHILRIDGYERHDLPPFDIDTMTGKADEFRWAPGGWLYFKRGDEYFKLHVDIPVTQNCRMQDVEVSEYEFFNLLDSAKQYNMPRVDRTPDATDTAILRGWYGNGYDMLDVFEETSFLRYEAGYECLEIGMGDYCCTRLKGDTVDMQSCDMKLSVALPRHFAGVNYEWGAGDIEVPGYIYIYPLLTDDNHVGKPYIYQTTPSWVPTGRYDFWAADGWFYVEGYDPKNDRQVYHKLRLP